jgi:ABC-type dipeptide/oligopeptide/nickel transport system permease subunit
MQTVDFSLYIVIYNLIIGVLIMIASEKLGVYAGYVAGRYKKQVSRLTHIGALAFGSCVAVLSAGIYVFGHLLRV